MISFKQIFRFLGVKELRNLAVPQGMDTWFCLLVCFTMVVLYDTHQDTDKVSFVWDAATFQTPTPFLDP